MGKAVHHQISLPELDHWNAHRRKELTTTGGPLVSNLFHGTLVCTSLIEQINKTRIEPAILSFTRVQVIQKGKDEV